VSVNGAAWQNVSVPAGFTARLTTHPTDGLTAYAFTCLSGCTPGTQVKAWKSTNAGRSSSWTSITGDLPLSVSPSDIAVDPINSNILYLATYQGVYKSTNGGVNWTRWIQNLPAAGSQSTWRIRTNDQRPSGGNFNIYIGLWGSGVWFRNGAE
jgi:photosystem II stability/assembly factor-like uncharacterized protein